MANRKRLSRPPRILIASDQNHGLRELEGFLGQHGYSVLRVYAGAPVLERAREVRPDVILLDARLADRDSLALGNALRDDPLIGTSTRLNSSHTVISYAVFCLKKKTNNTVAS